MLILRIVWNSTLYAMDIYIASYAMDMQWNMPSTVLLNYHTYFQTTTCTSGTNLYAKIISVRVQYHNKLSILHANQLIDNTYMLNKFGTSTYCTKIIQLTTIII